MENNIKPLSFHCVEYRYILGNIVSDIFDDNILYGRLCIYRHQSTFVI